MARPRRGAGGSGFGEDEPLMQQRRLRLGDILDDYCPRERRITNHAVVAMIDDEVKQTRCTTCDADHEYKQAKLPPARRKKGEGALPDVADGLLRARPASDAVAQGDDVPDVTAGAEDTQDESFELPAADVETAEVGTEPAEAAARDDDGPVHRRLIRATLPRPEGQTPERKAPDFTVRQPGGRGGREFDGNRNGHRQGRRPVRAQGGSGSSGQSSWSGGGRPGQGPRHGSGQGQGQRPGGNRPAHGGQRGGGRPPVPGQGHGRGGGRKRGR
jgi:hypothetical protein